VRFNFERGKSCRYSTYTYSKQLGEFLRVGEGGHGPPRPPPLNPPLPVLLLLLRPTVKCELRKCERVFCQLKCEPARDWSDIFRRTRSLPGATAFAHSCNFLSGNNMTRIHESLPR